MTDQGIGVGVAVVVRDPRKPGTIVTGIRKGSHGSGTLQLPGGHLEKGETFFACAEREAQEETGLDVRARKVIGVTNDIFEGAARHYVTIFVLCDMEDPNQQPVVREPDKCTGWSWMSWEDLQILKVAPGAEIFLSLRNLLDEHPQRPF